VVLLSNFIGGTILRVIMEVNFTPNIVIASAAATQVAQFFYHAGIFTVPDTAPAATIWSPNTPSGSYMQRRTASVFYRREASADDGGTVMIGDNRMSFDTEVKRRIVENDLLWFGQIAFLTGSMDSLDTGWTGRVLIQLP